ncbi:hypothetical protein PF005_g10869 [Phytophthora fragariae]|uniref:Uncharacterized protein n=1 Tax=Phytophthora fragariae TaxID=53985 RepID=A0A6A3F1L8_9STRA|nr:hypothetical protein PF003_g34599 [Phytophthora fragariae]KAE8939033.1 hypothetical protein PF009_g11113 [Phytophthora fragariae]KAE9010448.1 hypothetical protein PF011_g9822 [Phytophthora fragariae]KAE9118854.1 hypothetical protein PF007_g8775 [Phytophthora fragariae]KAE9211800.1 hypothetical protein PF005_g10869 [Phytophthora fragariae]
MLTKFALAHSPPSALSQAQDRCDKGTGSLSESNEGWSIEGQLPAQPLSIGACDTGG